ncbi:MAG: Uma2 family endonuclease, partial [Chloroflexi bacterium]|nr:Uma2 family endonuclease [Chloroflexota bacterium]
MTIVDKPRPTNSDPSLSYTKRPPTLQTGDRLTRAEFERRYKSLPKIKNAELIEGVVFMPSPVHFQSHSQPHSDIVTWLGFYKASTPNLQTGDNATLRLDAENEVQPDAALFIKGGKCKISDDDYLEGAPELIVEIAASSVSYDLFDKLKIYRRNRVQEYV